MSGNICRCGTYTRIRSGDQGRRRHEGRRMHERASHLNRSPTTSRRRSTAPATPAAAASCKAAPLTGLVLYVGLPGLGVAADEPQKYGGDGMPHGLRDSPKIFVSIAPDGTVSIVVQPLRDGPGRAHQHADDRRRRTRGRLEARARRAGAGRRSEVRQPGHRRLAQHAPLVRADAPLRRRRARRCWSRPRPTSGRCRSTRCRRRTTRSCTRRAAASSATARSRVAAAKLDVPPRAALKLKDPSQFRYIGKTGHLPRPTARHRHRQAQYGIDTRLPGMLYAVVARPPVLGGKVKSFDARRGDEGAGRRQGRSRSKARRRRRSSSRSAASSWSARTPGRRSRAASR